MLRGDPHDAHLRALLDQRAARAAVTADYDTDSPSIYSSQGFFSPRPNDFAHHETRSPRFYPASPRSPPETRNRLNELAESMLAREDSERDENEDEEEDLSFSDEAPDTVDAAHEPDDSRMSLLGPKMRFLGRAPWEDGAVLEEEDEPEPDRGRDGIRKGLGFRSSSRATTASSRPSGESSRSHQAKPKRSFETTSSGNSPYGRGGALHMLGQASLSSTSLLPQQVPRQPGLRLNLSFPRSDSPSSQYASSTRAPASPRSLTSSHAPSPAPRSNHEYTHLPSSNKPLTRRPTNDSATGQSVYSEDTHPYANPDLVFSYAADAVNDPSPSPTPARSVFNIPGVSRSDSTATVTESLMTTTSRSATGSTLTPDTSASSMSPQRPRSRGSMFHGKEISAPLPINPTTLPTLSNHNMFSPVAAPNLPAGWAERSASPTFALISLEQARAQRTRSATAHNLSVSSTSSTPFPETPTGDSNDHSPTNSSTSRTRARSISTGARAKNALQNIVGAMPRPERRDSEPATTVPLQPGPSGGVPGKTLKHKKSNGFMRLFNGARGGEKDGRISPPPVPSLSDGYAAFNAQQQSGAKLAKGSSHRVPPPQISPSVEAPDMWDDHNQVSPSLRPVPPSLSINTGPQSRLRATSTTDDFQTRTGPSDMSTRDWHQTDLPQSAPPNVTEFPALKLRPVSTLFSAHFGEHIVAHDPDVHQPGLDADGDTLSSMSASTVVSPITPGLLLGRGSGDKAPMATISEDQSALVQSLQDQIVSAKKAWQRHIWELEGQVRDLKAEVDGLRTADGERYCDACGRGRPDGAGPAHAHSGGPVAAYEHKPGVINRPRARTGTSARYGSAV
ncbi:hypothetical protein B0H15DRAFT_955584 [Mycena belliarum]|uniref:Uncharacterized protein n=1 Tax=Mycena belliarum TaxID=1033014 RepID=A0AAD6TW11_9AGAR|nr:hypothetical protein B0H15DRAFT_955584 [Mycena belliae]